MGLRKRLEKAWAVFRAPDYWLGPGFDIGGIGGTTKGELRDPYAQSVWVMSAINAITRELVGLELLFSTQRRKGEALLEDPALLQFWENPAHGMSRTDFMEATAGSFKLWGEFFWIKDDTWLLTTTPPARRSRLIWVNPKDMRHVVDGDTIVGWEWERGKGRKERLLPEQVIHEKRWNPNDRFRGLGELEAALLAAETDHMQGNFAKNLAANNGDRAPILVAKSGMPSPEQQTQIIKELKRKRAAAKAGRFEPAFLAGDIEQLEPTLQAPDAAYMAQRIQNRHEIYAAFGVPMSMADVQASYSIGSASDRFRLIEGVCMPLGDRISDAVERISVQLIGAQPGTIYAWFNWMGHSVVRTVLKEFIDSATSLWDRGMPWTEVNKWMGLGLPRFEGDDVAYLDFNKVPAWDLADPMTSSEFAESDTDATAEIDEIDEDADDGTGAMRIALALRHRKREDAAQDDFEECPCGCEGDALQTPEERLAAAAWHRARSPKEVKRWRALMSKRRATMRDFERKVGRALFLSRSETLAKIQNAPDLRAPETRAAAADLIYEKEEWDARFIGLMETAARTAIETAAQQLLDEIKADDPWTSPPAEVQNFLKTRENLLAQTADDIHREVMEALDAGLQVGESRDDLAKRVKATYNGISSTRARRIAQTETGAAYGKSRDLAMKQAGIEYKQWLTSGNDNVRESHRQANGQKRRIDEPFTVGGEALMFPGDPRGSAGNVINCHCVQIAIEQ